MKKLIFATFLICNFLAISHAQEFEWVLKPKFQGYDEVNIQEQITKFIIVKKDDKYGVITPKGKPIVPVKYRSISQVTENYFSAHHELNDKGKANTFFNKKGRELDFESEVQFEFIEKRKKEDQESRDKTVAGIKEIWPGATFENSTTKTGATNVILANGDTLLNGNFLKNSKVISGSYLMYQNPNAYGYIMIDREGNELLKLRKKNIYETKGGHLIIDGKFLVDQYGKIHFDEYEKVEVIFKSTYFRVKVEEDKFLVFDENLNQIFDRPASLVYSKKFDGKEFLISTYEKETIIYDTELKELIEIPLKLKSVRGFNHLFKYQQEELTGFYNLKLKEVVLEPKYPAIKPLTNDFFYASPTKVSRKERNKVIERLILDKTGEVVFSKECKSISSLGNKYFKILNSDKSTTILDLQIEEIKTVDAEKRVIFTEHWVQTKENGNPVSYPLDNYLKGDLTVGYDAKPKLIKSKDDFKSFYVVMKDEKIGFSDENGLLLHPCELEEVGKLDLFAKDYKGYFVAKKNGKWGILQRPSK